MRVTYPSRFAPERILPRLTLCLPPAAEYCAAVGLALADGSALDARVVVALRRRAQARVPASMAELT